MPKVPTTREKIGVTQQVFAEFLNISLSQLAMAETNKRNYPVQALHIVSQIDICLLEPSAEIDTDTKPIEKRYKTCLLQIETAQRKLEKLLHQYQQCCNAITVANNLHKSLPQATPAQLQWLKILATDAQQELNSCGKAQQQLLQVTITTLEAEAAALLSLLAPL